MSGLRREEVALLAGISVDYYTRLEKGRLKTASAPVLDAIARALQLDPAERAHLHDLARAARGETADRQTHAESVVVRPALTWMLDAMSPCPAYVRNAKLDVLASNAMGRVLYAPAFDRADEPPNLAVFCFLDERARAFFPEWSAVAQGMMALLRAELGRNPDDQGVNQLIDRLADGSDTFRRLWAAHNVRESPAETTLIEHPDAGTLLLALEAMNIAAEPGLTMVTYAAEPGSASSAGLSRLSQLVINQQSPLA